MNLDVPTIAFMGALVSLGGGAFLLLYWLKHNREKAVLYWGASSALAGVGIGLLVVSEVETGSFTAVVALIILQVTAGGTWVATEVFHGRKERRPFLVVALTTACLALVMAQAGIAPPLFVITLISAAYFIASAIVFALGRAEGLWARWPMVAVLALQSVSLLLLALLPWWRQAGNYMPPIGPEGLIHFASPVFVIGGAVCLLAMVNERFERSLKTAAIIDPLTNLLTRKGFFEYAQRHLDHERSDGEPLSILVLDLDYFKSVNDRFGHAKGDEVLRIFGNTVRTGLRPFDIAGRIGGEEFAALLPGCSAEVAGAIAQRLNKTFAAHTEIIAGDRVCATVSIGVAAMSERLPLSELMARADRALYAAKMRGRNRVILWRKDDDQDPSNIIRLCL